MDAPILRVDLERMKSSISHMFNVENTELQEMVSAELARQLNLECVQALIVEYTRECVHAAIKDLTGNYRLKAAITNMIADMITERLTNDPPAS